VMQLNPISLQEMLKLERRDQPKSNVRMLISS
jgi:hypothetical protein